MQAHHDDSVPKITPPGNSTKGPLTPPLTDKKPTTAAVVKSLQYIRRLKSGRNVPQHPWHELKLQPSEYAEFLHLLRSDEPLWVFTETKLRYDYDSTTSSLVIRMPTQIHEVFIARVVNEIQRRLAKIADGDGDGDGGTESSSFARKITYNGSGRLTFRTADNGDDNQSIIKREPDAVFKHEKAHWPGVVIEVSYSQKTKAIPYLADNYILESDANIQVVVGLDLDYKTKKATVSMWRPRFVTALEGKVELEATQTLDHQIFRDEQGNANPSREAGLKLELKDFAPPSLPLNHPSACARDLTDSFLIDSTTLCGFLDEAEREEQESRQKAMFIEPWLQGTRKRYRVKTPPEELDSEDEKKFSEDERRVRTRMAKDDSPYKSSG